MSKKAFDTVRVSENYIFEPRPTIDFHPAETVRLADQIKDCEGTELTLGDPASITAISWWCNANVGNRLAVNGSPISAQSLRWQVTEISWQPGAGWPVYTSYCPQGNYAGSMRFPNAKRHQIVPVFGGLYWSGCYNPAEGSGRSATEVVVWVNDDKYDDNYGGFRFTILGWR